MAASRYFKLEDASLAAYVRRAQRLLEASRMPQLFPDARAASRLLGEMGRQGGAVNVSTFSGWPLLEECTRVRGYPKAAREELERSRRFAPERKAELERLAALQLPPVTETRVLLVEEGKRAHRFQVWRDAYDLEWDLFVRMGVHLSATDARHLKLARTGVASLVPAFERMVERLLGYGCRGVWRRLSKLEGLRLEEVSVSALGPLQLHGTGEMAVLKPLFEGCLDAAILHAPLERASVELKGHRNDDPLVAPRDEVFEVGTYRERRWAATADIAKPLSQWLASRGVRLPVKVA